MTTPADLIRVQRFDLSRLLDWFDGQPEPIPDDVVHAATNLRVWLQDHRQACEAWS